MKFLVSFIIVFLILAKGFHVAIKFGEKKKNLDAMTPCKIFKIGDKIQFPQWSGYRESCLVGSIVKFSYDRFYLNYVKPSSIKFRGQLRLRGGYYENVILLYATLVERDGISCRIPYVLLLRITQERVKLGNA